MCNHAIGFCTVLDDLVYYNYPETTKIEFLSEKCPNDNRDLIFNYCPLCGEKIKEIYEI